MLGIFGKNLKFMVLPDTHNIDGSRIVHEILIGLGFQEEEADRYAWYIKHHDVMLENENRDLDRHSRERAQILSLAKDILAHNNSQQEVTGAVNEAAKEAE